MEKTVNQFEKVAFGFELRRVLSFDVVLGLGVVGLDIGFEFEGQLADFEDGGPGLFLQRGVAVQVLFLFELEAWG